MHGSNPTRDAIEESLTFAAEHGLIREWKRLPGHGANAKWEVVVRPSVHAAVPAEVVTLRTYAEAQVFTGALTSARSGMLSDAPPALAEGAMFVKGDKIQSDPEHRHTMVAGHPVTGTVDYVRPGGGLVDVVWDSFLFHGEPKQLPPSVELTGHLEHADAPTLRRTTAATHPGTFQPVDEATILKRMDDRIDRLHQERVTGARRDLKRWATVYSQRDELIRAANAAGVGVNEIARTMGIAKTTVLRVLHPASDQ